jgi:hypothetical protein
MLARLGLLVLLITMSLTAQDRIFELRTYYTVEGKLNDLLVRFRDHTTRLFEKHGMQNIGYWVPKDRPNVLIYIVAHKDEAAAKASWAAFRQDPDWVKARTASEASGKIVDKVESVFMSATDFSKMK